jgi:REP element-mobilizing transposase RayT
MLESDGRTHPVHQPVREAFNTPIIVFLTVISKGRKPILADVDAHLSVLNAWRTAKTWLVGRYVVMPDHVHLFCAPAALVPEPLIQWISFWKSAAARKWPRRGDAPIWQRHFWDTQLRRGENYDEKWEYIRANPLRAGLVSRVEDWPYQGELNELRW